MSSDSERSSIHFTGLAINRLITQMSGSSGWPCIFSPKPPPMSGAMTWTWSSSRRSAPASTQRIGCGFCDEPQKVMRSERASHLAT